MINKKNGFTLVELMVTIVVAGILLAIGVPSLTSIYESVRVNNNIEKINSTLSFARNQAISYGTTVNVCAYASPTSCGTNWSNGIRVYLTDSSSTDHELRVIDGFTSNDNVSGPSGILTFSPEGLSSGGSYIYCPSGKSNGSKSVTVGTGGLIAYGADDQACS